VTWLGNGLYLSMHIVLRSLSPHSLPFSPNNKQVDTFVCLQSSYTEYGCDDYRRSLRRTFSAPPCGSGADALRAACPAELRFLHCPVPDFGVLADASLLALVAELQVLR